MKGTTQFNDFKDLKDALAEVRKNNPPAETQYQKQAKKMGYNKDPKLVVSEQTISEASAFDGMVDIVNKKGAKKVEGVMIDMFTASVIVKAYTKVNASNKEKMKKANVHTLVALAQKVMGLKASNEFGKDPLKGFPYNETNEAVMNENVMSDMLIDIQQGATAKELSKTYKMPLSMAKDFLKSYYGQKKGPRKEEVKEGTWQTPKDIPELKKLMTLVSKPVFATKKSDVEKYVKTFPFGDDELYDALESLYYEKDSDGKIARPIKVVSKFEKTDLNKVAMDSLNGRWLTVKKKGTGYDITHIMFDYDEVEEAVKRKSGSLRPTKRMKIDLNASKGSVNFMSQDRLDPVGKADDDIDNDGDVDSSDDYLKNRRKKISKAMKMKEDNEQAKRSPFKLKSRQYPKAVAIVTEGYGVRHASIDDLLEACDSFGMITEQELQLEQLEKTLGKTGFLTYNKTELDDIFEDRETQRIILALESVTEDNLEKVEYDRKTIDKALEEELDVEFVKPDGMKAVGPVLKMCENTYNLKDKHTGKSFTFKYAGEDMKTFNEVISEAKFPKKLVRQAGGIAFDKRYVGGDMTGAIKAIEKLKKGLSDDPQVRDMLRLANESFNNQFYNALSEDEKTAYQKFFSSALKKYGVSSPAELEGDKEKEFYNYVDKNWSGKGEKKESVEEGKYTAYSDLLLMKARIIDKEGPKSDKLPAVDSQIRIVMKRLGIKEEGTTKVDGRIRPFKEKMRKLGYIKNNY
tara:strand:+ start:28 stop:2259 length:2232 start_codon:yes stop_codon:yes gene_type:complete